MRHTSICSTKASYRGHCGPLDLHRHKLQASARGIASWRVLSTNWVTTSISIAWASTTESHAGLLIRALNWIKFGTGW